MKSKPIVFGLALASLYFAVLLPPEAYPNGRVAVLLCATFAFFAAVIEHRISSKFLWGGMILFGLLLAHSLWISVDLYRSLEFLTSIWTYYCLLGFFLYTPADPLKPVAVSMVALSIIVSGYGLFQYLWGFDQLQNFIFYSASDQVVKAPALDRVASRRVFSTLALPGTLWGFLAMALPFHAALWSRNRIANALLAGSAVILLAAGFLTRSFGFLLGLLALALAWLVLRHRKVIWNRITVVLLVLVIAGGAFYSARRGVIEGANPAALRFKNWVSAWTIFSLNPLGTGLNTYGVVYPRYMLPGGNETQYTHNTPLQLMSELGFPLLAAAAIAFLFAAGRWKGRLREASPYLVLALVVWCIHNLIDIDVYFPSVGVIGAVLAGALFRKDSAVYAQPGKGVRVLVSLMGVAAIVFSGFAFLASELQHRAQMEYESNKPLVAAETLAQAKALMPINSSLYHESGEVLLDLYTKKRDPKHLAAAKESFIRAIALSPLKVGPHVGLGLCLSSANNREDALKEIRIARGLFPDSAYVQAVARLMEQHR